MFVTVLNFVPNLWSTHGVFRALYVYIFVATVFVEYVCFESRIVMIYVLTKGAFYPVIVVYRVQSVFDGTVACKCFVVIVDVIAFIAVPNHVLSYVGDTDFTHEDFGSCSL